MRSIFTSLTVAGLLVAGVAFAQTASSTPPAPSVTFPVAELGLCASKQECKVYCDEATHRDACFSFAEAHGLMSKIQTATARILFNKQGPGGCSSKDSCRSYCSNDTHKDECNNFAVKQGLRAKEDVDRDKNFEAVLKNAGGPGGCVTTQSCKEYCSDQSHIAECKAFAELHGFMRLRHDIASSTNAGSIIPPRKFEDGEHMGSTTPRMGDGEHKMGSTTHPFSNEGPGKFSSTTRDGKPGMPPKMENHGPSINSGPSSYVPNTFLGAAVVNVLGFFGW
ncbi:hypothetical protein KW798_02840 [Candidatus Parcubacteria bacterium]|nr:hypothetical protein [Candidatus Parcubacteria bacterium]